MDDTLANKFRTGSLVTASTLLERFSRSNLELYIRGIFHSPPDPTQSVYFNAKTTLMKAVSWFKGMEGFFGILADSPDSVSKVAEAIDEEFRNADRNPPRRRANTLSSWASFVAMLGNIKAFIMSICLAVVFTILLVSANTMAMSIRERTREVAVLKTLGFTRKAVHSGIVRRRGGFARAGGRVDWFAGRLGHCELDGEPGRNVYRHEGHSDHDCGCTADRRRGGIRQLLYTFLSRREGQHCGRLAAHRVKSFVYLRVLCG